MDISITKEFTLDQVMLVQSLSCNLLSIHQLCHAGYKYLFSEVGVITFRRYTCKVIFIQHVEGDVYVVEVLPKHAKLSTKGGFGTIGFASWDEKLV